MLRPWVLMVVLVGCGGGVVSAREAEVASVIARADEVLTRSRPNLMAGRYTLIEQGGATAFLPLALKKRIGVILGGVYNSGILATGPVPGARHDYRPAPPAILERVRRIEAVCRSHGTALPHAALRFATAHPAVASVVLGAVAPDEVARNVAALARPIPAGLWSDLKAEGLIPADVPTP